MGGSRTVCLLGDGDSVARGRGPPNTPSVQRGRHQGPSANQHPNLFWPCRSVLSPAPGWGGRQKGSEKHRSTWGEAPGSHWAVAVAGLAGSCWLRQLGDQTGMEGGRTALPCGAGLRPRPPPHPIPGMRRTADAFPDGRGCLGRAPGPMCRPAAV